MARRSPIAHFRIATGAPDHHARAAARSSRRSGSAGAARTFARAARSCRKARSRRRSRVWRVPELPEVETTARGLRARLIGLRLDCVGGVDWPRMLPQTSEDELRAVLIGLRVS